MLKKTILLLAGIAGSICAFSQETTNEIKKNVPSFSRVVASPRINVILNAGDEESVRLVYHRIAPEKIRIGVKGKTLRLYIEDSRYTEKMIRTDRNEKRSAYADVTITAYVTYRKLKHLEIRGEQELTCQSPITSEKFTLKAYGRNEINLSSVKAGYFKTRLFGENTVKIHGGKAEYQKYKLYGENRVNAEDLKCFYASATIFGESRLRLSTQDELKINSFGEARVTYSGDADVNRGLIFGKTEIRKIDQFARVEEN